MEEAESEEEEAEEEAAASTTTEAAAAPAASEPEAVVEEMEDVEEEGTSEEMETEDGSFQAAVTITEDGDGAAVPILPDEPPLSSPELAQTIVWGAKPGSGGRKWADCDDEEDGDADSPPDLSAAIASCGRAEAELAELYRERRASKERRSAESVEALGFGLQLARVSAKKTAAEQAEQETRTKAEAELAAFYAEREAANAKRQRENREEERKWLEQRDKAIAAMRQAEPWESWASTQSGIASDC